MKADSNIGAQGREYSVSVRREISEDVPGDAKGVDGRRRGGLYVYWSREGGRGEEAEDECLPLHYDGFDGGRES